MEHFTKSLFAALRPGFWNYSIKIPLVLMVLTIFLLISGAQAQILPNPDFETYSACPTTTNQTNLATPWNFYSGSPDYLNCGLSSFGSYASSGTGYMLSFHNASFSGPGFFNPEYLFAPLVTSLTVGVTYSVSWDLNNIQNPTCGDFGMLFYHSSSPPAVGATGIVGTPQVVVPQASIPANSYTTFSHTFTATTAYDRVVIGPIWNGGPCAGFTKIILFDNMSMTGTALPMDLLSFSGTEKGKGNLLNWSTATETNCNYYSLESSENGSTFQPIETVSGSGNSNKALSYQLVDKAPIAPTTYYRIKQIDLDGNTDYSDIISVQNSLLNQIRAYPNPFGNSFTIEGIDSASEVEVRDYLGRIVFKQHLDGQSHRFQVELDTKLLPGTYVLRIQSENELVVKNMIRIK